MEKNKNKPSICSSAAEYLTFVACVGDNQESIEMRYEDENRFLEFNEHEILLDNGRVTHEIAKSFAESEFEKYRIIQNRQYKSDFDRFLALEQEVGDSGEKPE